MTGIRPAARQLLLTGVLRPLLAVPLSGAAEPAAARERLAHLAPTLKQWGRQHERARHLADFRLPASHGRHGPGDLNVLPVVDNWLAFG